MKIDIANETWAAVKKACNEGIEHCRDVLENKATDMNDVSHARGEISAFRAILALAEPRTINPSGDYSKRSDRSGI